MQKNVKFVLLYLAVGIPILAIGTWLKLVARQNNLGKPGMLSLPC